MSLFHIDEESLYRRAELARNRAKKSLEVDRLLNVARECKGLDADSAWTLWHSTVETEVLYEMAREIRRRNPVPLETFSPLYLTNTCDAECKMCGMRRDNTALRRETADLGQLEEQLDVLVRRGMYAVALLTGEYRQQHRLWAMEFVNAALRGTQRRGFRHVLVNVGSIDEREFESLLDGLPRNGDGSLQPKLTVCTFQETYSRDCYRRFMGENPDNPRADYDRRIANFDRAFDAGIRVANPGILVGLNRDLGFEMAALVEHTRHLLDRGMEVYLSVPRLRQIAGSHATRGADDEHFVRLVSLLSVAVPRGKIVLTTRESVAIQRKLVPIVAVLSSGSADVTPYTETGARFDLHSSQFEVVDQRPFEDILDEYLRERGRIENFQPVR